MRRASSSARLTHGLTRRLIGPHRDLRFHTRYIAFGCALIVAAGVQLDAISLLNRLALDDSFRAATSDAAKQLVDTADPTKSTSQSRDVAAVRDQYYKILSVAGLVVMPVDSEWVKQWSLKKVPGILLSRRCSSLWAHSFWYNVLKEFACVAFIPGPERRPTAREPAE